MLNHPPSSVRPPGLPQLAGDGDGAVIRHAGRYARECVLVAFEMIGGVDRLADWADKNPGEFFTKLYPKVITKEHEIAVGAGVEDLLQRLDAAERAGDGPVVEADFTIDEGEV